LEDLANELLALLAYMRDKFLRPAEMITRSRLSPVQFYAVNVLRRKGSLSMSELAGEMQISKQQLTPLVYKLIDNGLLARTTDENDRRIVRIEITESGRIMCEELSAKIRLALINKLRTLPVEELDELGQMLEKIHAILKNAI
jgi:DNA-binding MarR family transcriptional regulator